MDEGAHGREGKDTLTLLVTSHPQLNAHTTSTSLSFSWDGVIVSAQEGQVLASVD